jgi:hypothetical protein
LVASLVQIRSTFRSACEIESPLSKSLPLNWNVLGRHAGATAEADFPYRSLVRAHPTLTTVFMSVTVARFSYSPDGTIKTVSCWDKEGVLHVGTLNPFGQVETETTAWESGPTTLDDRCQNSENDRIGVYVTDIANGDFINSRRGFRGQSGSSFTASVASGSNGGSIEMHLDGLDGPMIGSLPVSSTGGWDKWQSESTPVSGASGTHDLYFLFRGDPTGELFNFDCWKFGKKGATEPKHRMSKYSRPSCTKPKGKEWVH